MTDTYSSDIDLGISQSPDISTQVALYQELLSLHTALETIAEAITELTERVEALEE